MGFLPGKFYLDDLFDDDFAMLKNQSSTKCDVYEKEGRVYIELDTPGFKKENIKIDIDNGYLTIEGESNVEDDDSSKNYIRKERSFSSFKRQFYVGKISEDDVNAKFNDGVLLVSYPKEEVKETKKFIEIN